MVSPEPSADGAADGPAPGTRSVPMFPLGSVLFPGADLRLHVFEARYRIMIRDVRDSGGEFGVVLIERGSEVGGGDERFDVGTLARIVLADQLPDGRWALAAVGTQRIRVAEWLADDPYPQARIVMLDDEAPADPELERRALAEAVAAWDRLAAVVRRSRPDVELSLSLSLSHAAAVASFELAARAPIGPLDAQRVLEARVVSNRLEMLARLIDERSRDLELGTGGQR